MSTKNNSFDIDFKNAANSFGLIREPLERLIGGKIYSLEKDSSNITLLDIKYGYDLIQNINSKKYGIASRIQPTQKSWDTFTIRYKRANGSETEYIKRIHEIAVDGVYPKWTSQAYVDLGSNKLISIAAIETKALYEKVAAFKHNNSLSTNYKNSVYINKNTVDNNSFIVVKWSFLCDFIKIYREHCYTI